MKRSKKILSLLLCVALCFSLFVFQVDADDALPQSAHPYENNCDETWEYTYPGDPDGFFITFSEDTYLEPGSLLFLDENGERVALTDAEMMEMYRVLEEEPDSEEAARIEGYLNSLTFDSIKQGDIFVLFAGEEIRGIYSGDALAGRTVYVPGCTVKLELISDESETAYGFKVQSVSQTAPAGVCTVSYYLNGEKPNPIRCLQAGEMECIPSNAGFLTDDRACIGWSNTPDGELLYTGGEVIAVTESISLYSVYTDILLRPDESYSFDNDYDSFAVTGVSVNYEGVELLTLTNYYMERADVLALLKNYSKTLGITPLGFVAIREALLYPVALWSGSCYGLSLTVALQHYGMLDLLSLQEGAEAVCDLEATPELVSLINYYQAQEVTASMTQTTANYPGTAWYRMQLKKMYEIVAGGDIVLFGLFSGHTYDSIGHSVLLTGAYDDMEGNHVLIAYDPNYSGSYADGIALTLFYISPDFSEIYSDEYEITGFNWLSDFSGFESFRIDGTGDSMSWHRSVIAHLKAFIEMIRELFTAFSIR